MRSSSQRLVLAVKMAKLVVIGILLLLGSVCGRPKGKASKVVVRKADDTPEDVKFQNFMKKLKKAYEENSPDKIEKALKKCEALKEMLCNSENPTSSPGEDKEWLISLAKEALEKTTREDVASVFMSETKLPSVLCNIKTTTTPTTQSKTTTLSQDVSYDAYLSFLVQRKKRSLKARDEKRRAGPLPPPVPRDEVHEKRNGYNIEEYAVDKDGDLDDSNEFQYSTTVPPTTIETPKSAPTLTTTTLGVDGQFDEAFVIDPNHPNSLLDDPDEPAKSTNDEQDPKSPPEEKRVSLEQNKVPDLLDEYEEPTYVEKKSDIPDNMEVESLDASKEVIKEVIKEEEMDDDVPREKPKVGREIKYEEDDES